MFVALIVITFYGFKIASLYTDDQVNFQNDVHRDLATINIRWIDLLTVDDIPNFTWSTLTMIAIKFYSTNSIYNWYRSHYFNAFQRGTNPANDEVVLMKIIMVLRIDSLVCWNKFNLKKYSMFINWVCLKICTPLCIWSL